MAEIQKTTILNLAEKTQLDSADAFVIDTASGTKKITQENLIDDTLEMSGKLADAKAVGDAIEAQGTTINAALALKADQTALTAEATAREQADAALKADISESVGDLKSDIGDFTGNESLPIATSGFYRLSNATASTDPESNASYTCTKVSCSAGAVFRINGGSYGNAARLYAFVDSSLNILKVTPSAYTAVNELIKAPANTAYLYVNSYNVGGNKVTLIKGEPLSDKVDGIINEFSEITETSPNMLDESTIAVGYIGTNGNISTNNSYRYYEQYIDVRDLVGETLYFNNMMRFVTAYNENKAVMSSSGAENITNYTIPNGVAFIRVSIFVTYADLGVMVNSGDSPKPYQPYGKFVKWSKVTETQKFNRLEGVLGKPTESVSADSVGSGESLEISDCNISVKKNTGISAFCKFDSFVGVTVGKGFQTNGGTYVEVTATDVIVHIFWGEDRTTTFAHGLTIDEFLNINLYETMNDVKIDIMTLNGSYSCSVSNDGDCRGVPFFNTASAITDAKLTCSFADLTKPLWLFGDSYLGKNSNRIMYYMMQMGYTNYAVIGYPGMPAPTAFTELIRALKYGCPNYIVWMLGMNGSYNDSVSALNSLLDICGRYNIKPILYLVPSVPQYLHEQLNTYIKSLGYPYIDGYNAVGSDSNGNWYDGYLSADNVHPTEKGARAIAMRMLVDCSEFMLYGKDDIGQ